MPGSAKGHARVGRKAKAPTPDETKPSSPLTPPTSHTRPPSPSSPSPPSSPERSPPPDPKPKWRGEFFVEMRREVKHRIKEKVIVAGDTGCDKSCMSEEFFVSSPYLQTRPYRPMTTRGKAINGTKVLTMGIANIPFRINGRYLTINVRIVRGLVRPLFLGWDWFSKYGAKLDPDKGVLEFPRYGDTIPLVANSLLLSGCYYQIPEDTVIPANSKMHMEVQLKLDNQYASQAATTVITDPFMNAANDVWACRGCSKVKDGMFMTEFVNCYEYSVKLEAGRVLGYAEFVDDEEFDDLTFRTEMQCNFKSEDSAYESGESSDDEEMEEIDCDSTPTRIGLPSGQANPCPPQDMPPPPQSGQTPTQTDPCPPQDTPPPDDGSIPPGAKKLKIDYSKISKEALPFKSELQELLEGKHQKAFSRHDRDYGKTDLMQYRAHVRDRNDSPIAQPPYRTRPEMREIIDNQAHQMIADGLISHSTSPYSAPIMLAKKKCGGWRFLTDFRKVNEKCEKVVYPLPRIEDSIQRLEDPCFFSSMDLTKGFWQIPIHPDDRKFFAFSTESMHLEYLVAPMGAKNSPSYLSALMQLVLRGLPPQHVISYLDDILVADSNMTDHLHHLDQVLDALEKAGLKLNPAKCSFARDSVVCLGHKLSKEGVAPDPANIEKIRSWQAPDNAKKLKTFLGLTGYYRQFVKDYSKIAQGLTDLTHDDVPWIWTKDHQAAFEELKRILVSNVVMNYPDFSKPFIVKSDASLGAIGYVLTQKIKGKEKVISYGSKKLNQTQQRWSTYDREFFALLCAIRANAHYLRHAPFIAITDHRPLLAWRKVDAKKDPTGRRTRWSIELDTYDFELIFKKGKIHSDADALSRRGEQEDDFAEDSDEFEYALLGMSKGDEYSAVKFNAKDSGIEKLRKAQDADCSIAEARNFIKARKRIPRSFPEPWYASNSRWFLVKKGILYKKAYSEAVHSQILQAVIPDTLRKEVMKDLHGSYMAGHPSADKMLLTVKRYAIWPSINGDIEKFIAHCKICDQMREPTPQNRAPRIPLEARNVWDHVVCDLVMLPSSSVGFHYVLVFIDVFSGYVKLYKLKTKSTEGVARAFENLTCLIGPPKLLTSDNGGEFTSKLLEDMCKVKGAEKRTSVAYRPQSQGNVERFNRTLIKELTKRLLQYGSTWVEHLQYVEWSYNTTPRANDKMSPYLLMYGRDPPLPSYTDVDEFSIADKGLRSYFKKVKTRSKEIYDEARRRMIKARAKEVEAYNKKAKHKPLSTGEIVYEKVHDSLRTKLQPKWSGKLTVTKRRTGPKGDPGTTYVVQREDGTTCLRNFEQLKRARTHHEVRPNITEPQVQATPTSGIPHHGDTPKPILHDPKINLSIFAAIIAHRPPQVLIQTDSEEEITPMPQPLIGLETARILPNFSQLENEHYQEWEELYAREYVRLYGEGDEESEPESAFNSVAASPVDSELDEPDEPFPTNTSYSLDTTPDRSMEVSSHFDSVGRPPPPHPFVEPPRPPLPAGTESESSPLASEDPPEERGGVLTRHQRRREEERLRKQLEIRDIMRKGMSKLHSSGEKMLRDSGPISEEDNLSSLSQPPPPISPFSTHDLIRNRIAEPEIFDVPTVDQSGTSDHNEILVISTENQAATSSIELVDNVSRFSFNPLSFLHWPEYLSTSQDNALDEQTLPPVAATPPSDAEVADPLGYSTPREESQ